MVCLIKPIKRLYMNRKRAILGIFVSVVMMGIGGSFLPRDPSNRNVATAGQQHTSDDQRVVKAPDRQFASEIQSQLFRNPQLKNREISVTFSKGVVTVSGQVASNEERFQAGAIVRRAEGVKQVKNMLDVIKSERGKPPAPREKWQLRWVDCRHWRDSRFWEFATLDDVVSCLNAGSQPMAQDQMDGTTPLHWAVRNSSNPLLIEALVDAGADPNARHEYAPTPLQDAVKTYNARHNPAMVEALLSAGADPMIRYGGYGNTLLHQAVEFSDNLGIVKALLGAGIDPNTRNKFGATPLHVAAQMNENAEIFKALLNAGADPNARNKGGQTTLDIALRMVNNPEVFKVLKTAARR